MLQFVSQMRTKSKEVVFSQKFQTQTKIIKAIEALEISPLLYIYQHRQCCHTQPAHVLVLILLFWWQNRLCCSQLLRFRNLWVENSRNLLPCIFCVRHLQSTSNLAIVKIFMNNGGLSTYLHVD